MKLSKRVDSPLGATCAIVSTALGIGCTSPVRVVQVKSQSEPVQGVRYVLRRPAYGAGLQFKGIDASKECVFRAVITTKMELDEARYFEVQRPPWYVLPLHSLSDTKVSVLLDDEGALTSVNFVETDKALEFVKAAAELAVKAAAFAKDTTPEGKCGSVIPPTSQAGWDVYWEARKLLKAELEQLKAARQSILNDLSQGSTSPKARIEALAALDARTEAVKKSAAQLYLPLDPADYEIRFDPATNAPAPTKPIVLDLKTHANTLQCAGWSKLIGRCS